jgi:hypothetical protein
LEGGPPALMWSIGIACVVAVALLLARFRYMTKKRFRA